MGTVPLKFLSEAKLDEMRRDVSANRDRYVSGDFRDLACDNGWGIESVLVEVDQDALAMLDGVTGTAEAEITNSLITYRALNGMTPALAREERVWVRLTHVECLGYSRDRWLRKAAGEDVDASVHRHLFAPGRTGIRDDNALSRLWWNMHIATIADPNDSEGALRLILKTADIRQAFVERPGTAARKPLARAVIRAMRSNLWITSTEAAFRQFMIELNRNGGGILFEALTDEEADSILAGCASRASAHLKKIM